MQPIQLEGIVQVSMEPWREKALPVSRQNSCFRKGERKSYVS
jgi:hypothetical protein